MFADLGVVQSGQPLKYTLLVSNLSATDSATNVKVIDTLPAGATFSSATAGCTLSAGVVTCNAPTLAAGAFVGFEITIAAPIVSGPIPQITNPPTPLQLPQITNTATVSALEADPNSANNTASLTTLVLPVTDLSITKTGPATATLGSTIAFAIGVTNHGPSDARSVIVYDPLPVGTTVFGPGITSPDSQICGQEISTPSFPNNPHAGEYGCRFESIAAGTTVTMTFSVQVGPGGAIRISRTTPRRRRSRLRRTPISPSRSRRRSIGPFTRTSSTPIHRSS